MSLVGCYEPRKTQTSGQQFNSLTGAAPSYQSASGRFGGPSWKIQNGEAGFIVPSLDPHCWEGCAFKVSSLASLNPIWKALDSAGAMQLILAVTTLGSLQFYLGNTSTPVGPSSSNGIITPGVWYHRQIEVLVANSGGKIELRFNGEATALITFSGDTQATALANIGHMRSSSIAGIDTEFCHAWILDSATTDADGDAAPTGYQGDGIIKTDLVTADGSTNDFSQVPAQSAGSHHLNVDEAPADADTSYLASSTVNQVEEFGMTPGVTVGPKWAAISAMARIDDAGPRSIKVGLNSAGTDKLSGDWSVPSSYAYSPNKCVVNDPHTAAAWTAGGYNAAKPKIKISA